MLYVAVCSSFTELIVSRFVAGAGSAIFMGAVQLYMADISNIMNRSRTVAPVYAAFGVGMMAGPAIGGILGSSYGTLSPLMVLCCDNQLFPRSSRPLLVCWWCHDFCIGMELFLRH